MSFLIWKPLIFFGFLTFFFSFLLRPSWLDRWKFILITLFLNFILEAVVFFIYNLRYNNSPNYQNPSELVGMYPIFAGIYLPILSFWAFIGWWKGGKKNNLLWAFWSGIAFAFIFLVLTRLQADESFAYHTIHRYLVIASIGVVLCFSSLLTILYDKISRFSRHLSTILILLLLIIFYITSNDQISEYFNSQLINGRSTQAQDMMHQRFLDKFSKYNYDPGKSSLFYFDTTEESSTDGLFFQESFQSNFMYWMHLRTPKLVNGCIQDIGGTVDELKKLVKIKNGVKGIELGAYCIDVKNGTYASLVPTLFLPENFYSFKIKNRQFVDIREEILKELGFDLY